MSSDSGEKLNVAVCQMTSVDDFEANAVSILELADQAAASGPLDLICFPENSIYMRLREGEALPAVDLQSSHFQKIQDWGAKHQTVVHLGSVPLELEGKTFNSEVILFPDGRRTATYQKMHLFDVDISGHRSYRESDSVRHGPKPSTFKIGDWSFGSSICYDLRFSELYRVYADAAVDGILVPAAFTVPTGKAHWEILLRARAIESQAYVLAAAQAGDHRGRRSTFGHSIIIDAWGTVLGVANKEVPVVKACLEKKHLSEIRTQIPMRNHRRDPSLFKKL